MQRVIFIYDTIHPLSAECVNSIGGMFADSICRSIRSGIDSSIGIAITSGKKNSYGYKGQQQYLFHIEVRLVFQSESAIPEQNCNLCAPAT
jgi:hypothetical protein